MKLGIFDWFGYEMPIEERVRLIADAGFDNISIWAGDQEIVPDMARRMGMFVENLHTDYENTNALWTDEPESEGILNRYLDAVRACADYSIPVMVVHLSGGDNPPEPSILGIERLKRVTELAERNNIIIALENLKRPAYIDYVYERIQSDKLQFCYDSGHENIFSKGEDLLSKHADRLVVLHLHDNNGIADQHKLPGDGAIDWNDIARRLKRSGYNGAISLEVSRISSPRFADVSPEAYLAEAYKKAQWVAQLVTEA